MIKKKKSVITYVFIDAANLFYGGEKSLGWKIDYRKLLRYLERKYQASRVFYYAGVELHGFEYSIFNKKPINLDDLLRFYNRRNVSKEYVQRVKFYRNLGQFGYKLRLKPTKIFWNHGKKTKKANCDVDLTFDMMQNISKYNNVVLLSGDGDFAILVKYLKELGKSVTILARAERTAKELRMLAGKDFRDFHYLREILKFKDINKD